MSFSNSFAAATVVFIASLAAYPVAADHAHHSPAKTVIAALSGATVEGEDKDGKTYVIRYLGDGSARRTLGGVTETGRWTVDAGGHYCETWPTAFGGGKKCTGVEVVGSLIILRGNIATTRTILPAAK